MSSIIEQIGSDFDTVHSLVTDLHAVAAEQATHLDAQITSLSTFGENLSHDAATATARLQDLHAQGAASVDSLAQSHVDLVDAVTTMKTGASRVTDEGAATQSLLSRAAERLEAQLGSTTSATKDTGERVANRLQSTAHRGDTAAALLHAQVEAAGQLASAAGKQAASATSDLARSQGEAQQHINALAALMRHATAGTLPETISASTRGAAQAASELDAVTSTHERASQAALTDFEEGGRNHAVTSRSRAEGVIEALTKTMGQELPHAVGEALSNECLPRLRQSTNDLTRTSMNVQNAANATSDIERQLPAVGELHDHVSSVLGRSRSAYAQRSEREGPSHRMDMAIDHIDFAINHMDMAIDHMEFRIDKMKDEMAINHMEMRIDKIKDEMAINHMEMRIDKIQDEMAINHMEMRIDKIKDEMKIEHLQMEIDKTTPTQKPPEGSAPQSADAHKQKDAL